ncbi:MAG TPA: HD domain-containing phosphohydrolase [Pirellulales bacterium]|nr:HD domain-containing phosphohydrolase [Pirellulales bacterium]
MRRKKERGLQHTLEIMLLIVVVGLACLFYQVQGYKLVVLNLFYLPVVLCAFFLGTYRAGILAVFCVTSASIVTVTNLSGFASFFSPLTIGLMVTVWGAVLGLVAILVGTLSDERKAKTAELHEAYVGVVEVLSRYLQSANARLKARSIRVAELSQKVAVAMRLPVKLVDDVRIAALLYDIGNVEVTTRVFRKAVGTLETDPCKLEQHTFRGIDLIHSLGSVLSGASPLLVHQEAAHEPQSVSDIPLGTRIIWVVRAYDEMTAEQQQPGRHTLDSKQALDELRRDEDCGFDREVIDALERVLAQGELDESYESLELTGGALA